MWFGIPDSLVQNHSPEGFVPISHLPYPLWTPFPLCVFCRWRSWAMLRWDPHQFLATSLMERYIENYYAKNWYISKYSEVKQLKDITMKATYCFLKGVFKQFSLQLQESIEVSQSVHHVKVLNNYEHKFWCNLGRNLDIWVSKTRPELKMVGGKTDHVILDARVTKVQTENHVITWCWQMC